MRIIDIDDLIASITDGGKNKANKVRSVLDAIKNEAVKLNEIKEIAISNSLLSTYFDSSGLGKVDTIYDGFAICNGANGTWNLKGLVSIGYDSTNYSTLGATGGSKDAVLIDHRHAVKLPSSTGASGTAALQYPGTHDTDVTINSEYLGTGETGVNKNMQPYIVVLKIQRIA